MGRLAEDPEAKLLLVTGRLAADKRQAKLVQAMLVLAQRRPIALVCLGDGPERARLESLARGLPQASFLSFTKDRAEYASILATADALVHGSVCETFGFVVAESLTCGTPVVAPNAGGAPALLNPNCSELYEPDASITEIAECLDRLLRRDPDALASAAVQAAASLLTMDQHFDALFGLYDRLLGSPDPRASVV
jgi:alpha-1,6-mannosyltransferase